MDFKSGVGLVTLIIAVLSYSLYFRNIFRGKTKPHTISWLIWAVLNGVTFLTQRTNGAGAGGWITGFSAGAAVLIFIAAIYYGEKNITKLDWYCVAGSMVSLSFWYLYPSGPAEVIFASVTFALGFVPTYRKGFMKPYSETAMTFALNGTKFLIAIAALEQFNLATVLYPSVVAITNLGFVALLLARRA